MICAQTTRPELVFSTNILYLQPMVTHCFWRRYPPGTGERIIFDNDQINPCGHYNPQQGAYTTPLNGYYQ